MKKIFFIFAISFFLFVPDKVFAQRGCCSWHGGVRGCDTSVGRQVCNDGTYSPSCLCIRITPTPKPTIPTGTNGTSTYYLNKSGGVDLVFDWTLPDNTGYSIVLSKVAGGDPGPLADTYESKYVFTNVSPGKWYVNLKEMINGGWSQVSYWTVNIPSNVKELAREYPTPTPSPTLDLISGQYSGNNTSNSDISILMLLGIGIGIVIVLKKKA